VSGHAPLAAIVGIAGTELTRDERDLFLRRPPAGFILFARNCAAPAQLRELTASLHGLFPGRHVPILIDQEGGRVMRMRPPHWPSLPAAASIGALAERDESIAMEAARQLGRAIGHELAEVGIDVDCAPCLDVARSETTRAIGDRAFAADPALVGRLGRAFMTGLEQAGILPVMKHMPGHGRAHVDSHELLPTVDVDLEELLATDLVPFRACADAPLGMTCHVVYRAVDPRYPATQSPRVISQLIRGEIGFAGILLSDDLGMRALQGGIADRALLSLEAGCDIALHCNGDLVEMEAVLAAVPPLALAVADRLQALLGAADRRGRQSAPDALARLEEMMAVA
jgi:beta-N-acetylhexosaminidase